MVGVEQIPVSLNELSFIRTHSRGVGDGVTGVREPGAVNASEGGEREREGLGALLPVSCLLAAPFSWPASPGHRHLGSGLH